MFTLFVSHSGRSELWFHLIINIQKPISLALLIYLKFPKKIIWYRVCCWLAWAGENILSFSLMWLFLTVKHSGNVLIALFYFVSQAPRAKLLCKYDFAGKVSICLSLFHKFTVTWIIFFCLWIALFGNRLWKNILNGFVW